MVANWNIVKETENAKEEYRERRFMHMAEILTMLAVSIKGFPSRRASCVIKPHSLLIDQASSLQSSWQMCQKHLGISQFSSLSLCFNALLYRATVCTLG